MLFSRFGINYSALPSRFRKGSVLVREQVTFQPSILVSLLTYPTNQLSTGGGLETENIGELALVHVPRGNPLESLSLVRSFSRHFLDI